MTPLRLWRWAATPAVLALAGCVPWTVRPLDRPAESEGARFDARVYAARVWSERLLPEFEARATGLAPTLAALSRDRVEARKKYSLRDSFYAVKGQVRVLRIDTSLRAGFAELDVAPFDGRADARLAIGPVIRGSALRDATGLIPFSQFVNQLDFADVSNALNERVMAQVIAPANALLRPGAMIELCGAFSLDPASSPATLPEIVAIRISKSSEAR